MKLLQIDVPLNKSRTLYCVLYYFESCMLSCAWKTTVIACFYEVFEPKLVFYFFNSFYKLPFRSYALHGVLLEKMYTLKLDLYTLRVTHIPVP